MTLDTFGLEQQSYHARDMFEAKCELCRVMCEGVRCEVSSVWDMGNSPNLGIALMSFNDKNIVCYYNGLKFECDQ